MAICFQSPLKPTVNHPNSSLHLHLPPSKPTTFICHSSLSSTQPTTQTISEPTPVLSSVRTFAPATVANLGPCFDFLGCAVSGFGDYVSLSISPTTPPGQISISSISGDPNSKLSLDPLNNCAGIAAISAMKRLNIRSLGLSLSLHKGLPLGSGLGSSAASAAASAAAVNALFGNPLSSLDLVLAGLDSEAKVSGYHADNIAPAVMGGFVLIQSYQPLTLIPLQYPSQKELLFVLVTPEFEAPTKKMRAALPKEITMAHHVWNSSQAAAVVAAVMSGDAEGLGRAMSADRIVEPRRAPLIPGMEAVKKAAIEAGAFGCTISGAGPTAVAVVDREESGWIVAEKMVEAFRKEGGLGASAVVQQLDRVGAKVVSSVPI
ncbi:homoserine kinase [Silene latifolia]|uniref:homoserine kinase n=1 Tax=Silene latifolia TaxID=37657 RepID=UPI003D7713C1